MKLKDYKPSPRVDDRRSQKGKTTLGQVISSYTTAALRKNQPNMVGAHLKRILGYKVDPESFRKSVASPDVPLRKRKK